MVTLTTLLAVLLSGINIGLGLRTFWKDYRAKRQPPVPHPLEAALRDIAMAIRKETS